MKTEYKYKEFGSKLRLLRDAAKKSQQDVADYLAIKRSTYGAYEEGRNMPPPDIGKAIATFYGISLDDLYGESAGPARKYYNEVEPTPEQLKQYQETGSIKEDPIQKLLHQQMELMQELREDRRMLKESHAAIISLVRDVGPKVDDTRQRLEAEIKMRIGVQKQIWEYMSRHEGKSIEQLVDEFEAGVTGGVDLVTGQKAQ